MDETYRKIGNNIKKYRMAKHLTQQQLADKIGRGINFIGKVEVAFSHPSLKTLIFIANALEIKLKDLFDFE